MIIIIGISFTDHKAVPQRNQSLKARCFCLRILRLRFLIVIRNINIKVSDEAANKVSLIIALRKRYSLYDLA